MYRVTYRMTKGPFWILFVAPPTIFQGNFVSVLATMPFNCISMGVIIVGYEGPVACLGSPKDGIKSKNN